MKSRFSKTITSLMLVTALVVSGISYQGKKVKAAGETKALFEFDNLSDENALAAGTPATCTFDIPDNVSSNAFVGIIYDLLFDKSEIAVDITDSTGKSVFEETIPVNDEYWTSSTQEGVTIYENLSVWSSPAPGTYTLSLTFANDTYFYSGGVLSEAAQNPNPTQTPPQTTTKPTTQTPTQPPIPTYTPSLSAQSLTLTAGFSADISVRLASDAITWSSSNNSVATVNNGKITGKKAGSATITAKTAGGYTMTCNVKVVKNEYKLKKLSVKKVTYGKSGIDIYNVSYDKKGNLVLKTRILNNNSYKLKELRNVKIKIKDNNGKVIGTYSAKKIKKVNLKAGKAKAYTFKIKKSKLKNKKANLPLISTSVSGQAYYVR